MAFRTVLPREVLKMAIDSIRANKFRSFLTVLGIVVGIITAIVVSSILTGMRQSIVAVVEEYGTSNIYAFHLTMSDGPPNRDERNRKPLTDEDAAAIIAQSTAIEDVVLVNPGIGSNNSQYDDNMTYEGRNYRWAVVDGVSTNYDRVLNLAIREGRWLTEADDLQRRNVIVIGVDAREALFPNPNDSPVGRLIRMGGDTWEIVGVIEKRKSGFFGENEEDRSVFMPYRTSRKVAPLRQHLRLTIQAKDDQLGIAYEEVETILRQRRGVKADDKNNFDLKTADAFISEMDSIIGPVGIAAIAISCLGLLVGGIGVMNIMLVSVTERTKEIGIRKAIGATKGAIVLQFLLEAMTLTFFGGVIGIVTAVGISNLLILILPDMPAQIPLWAIIAALATSIGVGLIFGVLPARKASRLDPIECLRYE